jgi:hypothetical protein
MEDAEKILRWNLQEAIKEIDKPLDIGGILMASAAFGMMKHREEQVSKCQKELDDYLKSKLNGKGKYHNQSV